MSGVVVRSGCPDGGTCHHECKSTCWRVRNTGPLSGVFEGDVWPESVRQQNHEDVEA